MEALQRVRLIDPQEMANIAKKGDIDAWKNRLDAIQKVDPKLGELRNNAIKSLTTSLAKNATDSNASDETSKFVIGLAQQFAAGAPADFDLGSAMQAKAKEVMGRGSNLPPTYQAELIRSGLEKGGTVGIGPDRKGAVAGVLGKLLGSEAVAMEQQNANFAGSLAGAAQQITSNRMNILAGLSAQMQQFEANKQSLATQGLDVVNSEAPSKVGASGADMVNMYESRRAGENQKLMGQADLEAQRYLAQGEQNAGLIAGGTQMAGSILGGLFSGSPGSPKTPGATSGVGGSPVANPVNLAGASMNPFSGAGMSLAQMWGPSGGGGGGGGGGAMYGPPYTPTYGPPSPVAGLSSSDLMALRALGSRRPANSPGVYPLR
jgi:hypothetical protein